MAIKEKAVRTTMARRGYFSLQVCVWVTALLSRAAIPATVTVTRDRAPLWARDRVVATLAKGTRATVVETRGNWAAVRVKAGGNDVVGWLHREDTIARTPLRMEPDWLGLPGRAEESAGAEATWRHLLGKQKTVNNAKVTPVQLEAAALLPEMIFSPKGESFYVVESRTGTVRRITFPDFKEAATLRIGAECTDVALSQLGLLVLLRSAQQVWMLDAERLQPVRKISLSEVQYIAASPALVVGFATVGRGQDGMAFIDLRTGATLAEYNATAIRVANLSRNRAGSISRFQVPAVTPDGRYLLCMSGTYLQSFRIEGTALTYQGGGPSLGSAIRIAISADSKYLAQPTTQRRVPPGFPAIAQGTYIFKVTDITKPVSGLQTLPHCPIAFDKAAQIIYGATTTCELAAFAVTGARQAEYQLSTGRGGARQLLVHPQGRNVLVLTSRELYWVQLPGS